MVRIRDEKDMGGCAISGIMSEAGDRFSGEMIVRSIATMHERSNGLGGGFAAYGIYPENADQYALHAMFDVASAREETRGHLAQCFDIVREEPIPTRAAAVIGDRPLLHRYFVNVRPEALDGNPSLAEEDIVVRTVMHVNREIDGAFIISSGKNMGVFKGVGYPEDIGDYFAVDEYKGWTWLAHGRFPTNTTGWWGGAHPFGLLDWAVVHNGEISSYGINRRYLENYGYFCALHTDTEVITYLWDLLLRKHRLPVDIAARVLAPPFWSQIERMEEAERRMLGALRTVYGSALLNGPFSILVGHSGGMIGLNDRTKLRPMCAARKNGMFYVASEESAIREVCSEPDVIWHAEGGVPLVGALKRRTAGA